MFSNKNRYFPLFVFLAVLGFSCFSSFSPVLMQSEQDEDRAVWDSEFLQKRPKNTSNKHPIAKKIKYKRVTPTVKSLLIAEKNKTNSSNTQSGGESHNNPDTGNNTSESSIIPSITTSVVGITLWKLRRATEGEDTETARILDRVEEEEAPIEWVAERVNTDTPLAKGQRVRLTIEVPRSGYLYIIDREKYADGSYSDPFLVFPIKRAKGIENNKVQAGIPKECPSLEDKNSYFLLRSKHQKYVGESLAIIITPNPITNLTITSKVSDNKISKEQFKTWQKEWSTQIEINHLADGEGKTYTNSEKNAALGITTLSQEDPLPQTLYRVSKKFDEPLLLELPLTIKK